jgi:stage IV sporulation protein B
LQKPKQLAVFVLILFLLLFSAGNAWQAGKPVSPETSGKAATGLSRREFDGFGLFPLKEVAVKPKETIYLVPGGHSIGVLIRSQGVMAVGFSPVIIDDGQAVYPARDAGFKTGDVILAIDGVKAASDDQVRELIADSSREKPEILFQVERGGKTMEIRVRPEYCTETKSRRIGLFVRDNTGGVGTLTWFHPETGVYGALGHVVTNGQSTEPIHISEGRLLSAQINEIHAGAAGKPGEKVGTFVENTDFGDVEINNSCGIYGKLSAPLENPFFPIPLAAAYSHQISTGPAKILTVVAGQEIRAYDVAILRLLPGRSDGKNMILEVTDKSLLAKTGGIIQGMSGSPIIQNNRIIGAVTHVFVNDPSRGYGVFIENMLKESGILPEAAETLGNASQGFFLIFSIDKIGHYACIFYKTQQNATRRPAGARQGRGRKLAACRRLPGTLKIYGKISLQ